MTSNEIELCSELLKELNGDIVQKVAVFLMKKGPTPLTLIIDGIGEPAISTNQVKKVLQCLIQHNICRYSLHKKGFRQYEVDVQAMLMRIRFPHYIYASKTLFSDTGELLVEELLQQGQAQMTKIIQKVTGRLSEAQQVDVKPKLAEDVLAAFTNLAQTHFIQHCQVLDGAELPDTDERPRDPYRVPDLTIKGATQEKPKSKKRRISSDDEDDEVGQPAAKRQKTSLAISSSQPGGDIFWKLSYNRFDDFLRDQCIVEAVRRKLDNVAAQVVRTILRLSEVNSPPDCAVTNQFSSTEIFHALPKELGLSRQQADQYLSVLSEDSACFVQKVGESGGGMYVITFKRITYSIARAHIESVVQERFGSKCLRIFRLLLLKMHLEQKQIEEFAMIPAKEAKELLYRMFGENFITITEVPKTPDHAPSRTFYLFSVDLHRVAAMLLQRSYRALTRLMQRRHHETYECRRLMDRQQRVEAIAAQLELNGADEAQKQEIEDMITPPEREQLKRIKTITNKLEQSELQMNKTISVLQLYLKFSLMK